MLTIQLSKMYNQIDSDELEREIILMQQELFAKRSLLEECRKKLNREMAEHMQTKLTVARHLNEKEELKAQLDLSFAATKKVEEESNKIRELLIKLQVQMESYENQRHQLLERCYQAESENTDLKREMMELKEELRQDRFFQENLKIRLHKTEALVNETIKKQEILKEEHKQLEIIIKESFKCSEKLSEECKFQIKYIQEANAGQRKMEEEIIRLMAAYRKLKIANSKDNRREEEFQKYAEEWKNYQEEMRQKLEELEENNKRLEEELRIVTEQNEFLTEKFFNG